MRRLITALLLVLWPALAAAQGGATNPMFDSVNGVRSVIHADPTGINDSAPAINAALAADANGNFHNVYLPVGVYKLKSPITISSGRNTAGNITGQCLFSDNKSQATLKISTDYSSTAGSPVTMTGNAYGTPCIKDISIVFDNGYGGTRATAAALPNCGRPANVECKYPAAIDLTNAQNASIQDVYIGGAWDCIHAAWATSNGQTELRNISCGAYDRGLDLSGSTGIVNLVNYHFYPWSIGTQSIYLDGGTYAAYLNNMQGVTAANFFSQNGRLAIVGAAQPTFSLFTNLEMDYDNATLEVNSASVFVAVVGGYFTGSSTGANTACDMQVQAGTLQASTVYIRNTGDSTAALLCNSGGTLLVSDSYLALGNTGASAVSLTGGNTTLTGSEIDMQTPSAWTAQVIKQTAGQATITGNQIAMLGGSGTAVSMVDNANNMVTDNVFGVSWTFKPPGSAGSYVGTTWATYTPTVTCTSGALGAYTASGNYQRVGKQVQLNASVTFTTIGTCSGQVSMSEPVLATGSATGFGRETGVTGVGVQAFVSGGGIYLTKYDGTSLLTAGYAPTFSVNYVAQ